MTKYTFEHMFIQVSAIAFSGICAIAYLTTYKPFEHPLLLKLEIWNEICTIVLVDVLVFFSYANNSEIDTTCDIGFIVCLFSNVAAHLYFLVKDTFLSIKEKIKNCCKKKKQEEPSKKHPCSLTELSHIVVEDRNRV